MGGGWEREVQCAESAAICVKGEDDGQSTFPSIKHLWSNVQKNDHSGCLQSGESSDWKTGLDERLFTLHSFHQLKFEPEIALKLNSFCQELGKEGLFWYLVLMDRFTCHAERDRLYLQRSIWNNFL